ncbi:YggT family protein [Granulosicoccaceae sp. 1_MG-2023]|nr:YggT family protein [Granulosicoccaceae sp. 1_MG-2023]
MTSPGMEALSFLINTLFDLYIMVVALRFLMQMTRADYHNPLAAFVVKVTNPLLIPLRRVVPGIGGHDMAALVLCFLLIVIKLFLFKGLGLAEYIGGLRINMAYAAVGQVFGIALVSLVNLFFNVFLYSIVVLAILSWFNNGYNPVQNILYSITSPVLTPLRRIIPPIGGLDLSALAAIILIQLAKILVINSMIGLIV